MIKPGVSPEDTGTFLIWDTQFYALSNTTSDICL
jgi:hypothetical protein